MDFKSFNECEYIIEGIDIDVIKHTVSFNAKHENSIDTSTLLNPTCMMMGEIPVYSIFKRKRTKSKSYDGNPLIYALKGIDGWTFKNGTNDILNLLNQFITITKKIKTDYDTLITVPSSNKLNNMFLHRLNRIIKCENEITDHFYKLECEDVLLNYVDWKSIERDGLNSDDVLSELELFFDEMEEKNNGIFSYKYFKNMELRKYITKTMKNYDDSIIKYANMINDKDIVVLDDTISTTSTISETCKLLIDTYTPKSITVITLFSKLDEKPNNK